MKAKTERTFTRLGGHARDMLRNMAMAYNLPTPLLLRVIIESVLDAASEDGDIQEQLAAAARYCRRTGHVPECWLEVEGARFEDGPDDCGGCPGVGKETEDVIRQSWAQYGDDAANWGEQSDTSALYHARLEHKRQPCFASLVDAG